MKRKTTERVLTVVRIEQEVLRNESFPEVWDGLARMASSPGPHAIYLDLSQVVYMTAGGLGRLIALHKALITTGGELTLFNVSPFSYEILQLTRLTELVRIRPKESPAGLRRRSQTCRIHFPPPGRRLNR